jgi:NitT/TauT family transport system permease protein
MPILSRNSLQIRALQFFTLTATVLLWEVGGRFSRNVRFAVGTPLEVGKEFIAVLLHGRLHAHFFVTAVEAGTGLTIGVVLGSLVGMSFWFSRTASEAARPILLMAANAPVFALAPLLVIWLGIGLSMKIALAFYFSFFFAVANTQEGVDRVSKELVEIHYIFGGSRLDVFRKVVVPGALDAVFSAMRRSVALSLLGAFVGEFIASNQGLGYLILRSAGVFNVPRALAVSFAFVILAFLLDWIGKEVERRRASILQFLSVPRVARRS